MRKFACLLIFFICVDFFAQKEASIVFKGIYRGKGLYVQNTFHNEGWIGFCITGAKVNGKDYEECYSSTAYEIDIRCANQDIKVGDEVEIIIYHHKDCKPKILNENDFLPPSTYEIAAMSIDSSGTLNWKTVNESGKLMYSVEQFRWNKWLRVAEVMGTGKKDSNFYQVQVKFHSGKNLFRLKQVDFTRQPRLSNTVDFQSNMKAPELKSSNIRNKLELSEASMIEIYDKFGNIVIKGYGTTFELKHLPPDMYFLNYDNITTKIEVRKPWSSDK